MQQLKQQRHCVRRRAQTADRANDGEYERRRGVAAADGGKQPQQELEGEGERGGAWEGRSVAPTDEQCLRMGATY